MAYMKQTGLPLSFALLLIISSSGLQAEEDPYAIANGHPFEDFVFDTAGGLTDSEMANMRAQGFQMPPVEIGVILWDEVDSITRPKAQLTNTDDTITVTVE